jgi:steroid delta-isomerase
VIDRFIASYPPRDVEGRLALFSDSATFDDPAGLRCAAGKEQLRDFFESVVRNGFDISIDPVRRVVIGDEAIQDGILSLQIGDTEPAQMHTLTHFSFDGDGLIAAVRIYFDELSLL